MEKIFEMETIKLDPHFPPQFYADLWGVSSDTILRWFQDEPGVLKLGDGPKPGKRQRVEIRIPFSVAQRVHKERAS